MPVNPRLADSPRARSVVQADLALQERLSSTAILQAADTETALSKRLQGQLEAEPRFQVAMEWRCALLLLVLLIHSLALLSILAEVLLDDSGRVNVIAEDSLTVRRDFRVATRALSLSASLVSRLINVDMVPNMGDDPMSIARVLGRTRLKLTEAAASVTVATGTEQSATLWRDHSYVYCNSSAACWGGALADDGEMPPADEEAPAAAPAPLPWDEAWFAAALDVAEMDECALALAAADDDELLVHVSHAFGEHADRAVAFSFAYAPAAVGNTYVLSDGGRVVFGAASADVAAFYNATLQPLTATTAAATEADDDAAGDDLQDVVVKERDDNVWYSAARLFSCGWGGWVVVTSQRQDSVSQLFGHSGFSGAVATQVALTAVLGTVLLVGERLVVGNVRRQRYMRAQHERFTSLMSKAQAVSATQGEFLAVVSKRINRGLEQLCFRLNGLSELHRTLGTEVETVVRLRQTTSHFLSKLREILDLARMDTDGARLDVVPFNLWETLDAVAEEFARPCEERGVELVVSFESLRRQAVVGDRARVAQLARHLLHNAVRFTTDGAVILTASVEHQGGHAIVHLRVSDSGPGIPEEVLRFVLQPLGSDNARPRQASAGLGLDIVKRLVAMMHGQLRIRTHRAQPAGTEVTVQLRLRRARSRFNPTLRLPLPTHSVLIALPGSHQTQVLRSFFCSFALDVHIATSLKAAEDLCRSNGASYALVMLALSLDARCGGNPRRTKVVRANFAQGCHRDAVLAWVLSGEELAHINHKLTSMLRLTGFDCVIPLPIRISAMATTLVNCFEVKKARAASGSSAISGGSGD